MGIVDNLKNCHQDLNLRFVQKVAATVADGRDSIAAQSLKIGAGCTG